MQNVNSYGHVNALSSLSMRMSGSSWNLVTAVPV
jgi:hypothetical protein